MSIVVPFPQKSAHKRDANAFVDATALVEFATSYGATQSRLNAPAQEFVDALITSAHQERLICTCEIIQFAGRPRAGASSAQG